MYASIYMNTYMYVVIGTVTCFKLLDQMGYVITMGLVQVPLVLYLYDPLYPYLKSKVRGTVHNRYLGSIYAMTIILPRYLPKSLHIPTLQSYKAINSRRIYSFLS